MAAESSEGRGAAERAPVGAATSVSIIVPVLDDEGRVGRCVEALLAQVQGHLPDQVQERLNRLEDVFARTRVFRAPKMSGRV